MAMKGLKNVQYKFYGQFSTTWKIENFVRHTNRRTKSMFNLNFVLHSVSSLHWD